MHEVLCVRMFVVVLFKRVKISKGLKIGDEPYKSWPIKIMKYSIDLKQFKNTHPAQCRHSINGSSLYWDVWVSKELMWINVLTQQGAWRTLDVASYPNGCLSQLYPSQRCASRQNTV